jgi:nucleotide-binding universal stress UspA family protein
LIAMTKRGFSAIARLLVGSVADRVVRHSPVPVLLVRAESLWRRGTHAVPPEKILVPLDGSDRALRILPHVIKLARGFGSRIGLLHVARSDNAATLRYSKEGLVARSIDANAPPYEDADRPSVAHVERQMERTAAKLRKRGLRVSTMVLCGDPAEQIIRIERAQGYDLVAMCTHGRRGLERWLLGSVTEKVLRAADVPLMVLRNVYLKPGVYGARRGAAMVR